MYRETAKVKKYRIMRAARDRKRLEGPAPDYPVELPDLRRVIVVIDYDFGKRVNILRLYKTRRIDQYRVEANGQPWKNSIGMARILQGIRKSLPRVTA